MRQRGVHAKLRKTSGAEKHFREQAELSNAARFTRVASIEPTPGSLKGVTGNVPVAAEDPAGNRVGAIHSRRAILQYVDVIDHREGNEVNVHASAEPAGVQRTKGDTFSVNEHQGFFGQQAAQVELYSTVTTSAVEVDGAASFLRQKRCQVGSVADAQFLDVCRTIGVHRIGTDFFRGRNVGTGDNNLLDCNARLRSCL